MPNISSLLSRTKTISQRIQGHDLEIKADYYEGILIGSQKSLTNQKLDNSDIKRIVDHLKKIFPNHYQLIDYIFLTSLPQEINGEKFRVGYTNHKFWILTNNDISKSEANNTVQAEIIKRFCADVVANEVVFKEGDKDTPRRKKFRRALLEAMHRDGRLRDVQFENMSIAQTRDLKSRFIDSLLFMLEGRTQGIENVTQGMENASEVIRAELAEPMDGKTLFAREKVRDDIIDPAVSRVKELTGIRKALHGLLNSTTPSPSLGSGGNRSTSRGREYSDADIMLTHGVSGLTAARQGVSREEIMRGGAFAEDYFQDNEGCTSDPDAFE